MRLTLLPRLSFLCIHVCRKCDCSNIFLRSPSEPQKTSVKKLNVLFTHWMAGMSQQFLTKFCVSFWIHPDKITETDMNRKQNNEQKEAKCYFFSRTLWGRSRGSSYYLEWMQQQRIGSEQGALFQRRAGQHSGKPKRLVHCGGGGEGDSLKEEDRPGIYKHQSKSDYNRLFCNFSRELSSTWSREGWMTECTGFVPTPPTQTQGTHSCRCRGDAENKGWASARGQSGNIKKLSRAA